MTFRVIEGGGRPPEPVPGSVEEARTTIIDRVASAIWAFQDETPEPSYATWEEIKSVARDDPTRGYLVRQTLAQARAALQAIRPADAPRDADIEVVAAAWETSSLHSPPSACLCSMQGYIDEVLK